jgi:hypothetical protein
MAPAALSPDAWYATPLPAPDGYKASLVTRDAGAAPRDLTASFSL